MNRTTPKALAALAPGVTLGELSRRSGIAKDGLSLLFAGKRSGRVDTIRRIAEALGITIDAVVAILPRPRKPRAGRRRRSDRALRRAA